MSAPRTLGEVTDLPDDIVLRHILALLSFAPEVGGVDAAA